LGGAAKNDKERKDAPTEERLFRRDTSARTNDAAWSGAIKKNRGETT
jgi:hypothetical protein